MSSHLDNECKHKAVYPAKDNVQKCTVNISFYSRIPYMFCNDGNKCKSAEFMLQISKYFNMLVEDVFHVED